MDETRVAGPGHTSSFPCGIIGGFIGNFTLVIATLIVEKLGSMRTWKRL